MFDEKITQVVPILTSYDIDATEAFYQKKLGFETRAKYPNYLVVARGKLLLHFSLLHEGNPATTMTQAYIYVTDVDKFYAEFQTAGVIHPNGAIETKNYGMRQFTVQDSDNNALFFGQDIAE